MARYKNNTPQIVEGFLDKMFGAFVKKRGQQIAKDMGRKDPEMGRLLCIAAKAINQAEKRLKNMTPAEKKKHFSDLEKLAGL